MFCVNIPEVKFGVCVAISLEADKESAVDVMADRLCAAMHAFALCCQAHTNLKAVQ